jgi:hypothetical protein
MHPQADLSKGGPRLFRGFSSRGIELKPAMFSARDDSVGTEKVA